MRLTSLHQLALTRHTVAALRRVVSAGRGSFSRGRPALAFLSPTGAPPMLGALDRRVPFRFRLVGSRRDGRMNFVAPPPNRVIHRANALPEGIQSQGSFDQVARGAPEPPVRVPRCGT